MKKEEPVEGDIIVYKEDGKYLKGEFVSESHVIRKGSGDMPIFEMNENGEFPSDVVYLLQTESGGSAYVYERDAMTLSEYREMQINGIINE